MIESLIDLLTAMLTFATATMQWSAAKEKRTTDREKGEKTRRNDHGRHRKGRS